MPPHYGTYNILWTCSRDSYWAKSTAMGGIGVFIAELAFYNH